VAFIPHPDDESYSFGGTIALAAKAGWRCHIECASSGERGKRHDGGGTSPRDVARAREAELEASCQVLGAEAPRFWRLADGQMRLHHSEGERIERVLRELQPEVVLTLGADGAYGHPDHTALHAWVVDSWRSLPRRGRPALLFPVFPKRLFEPQWEKCRHMLGEPPRPSVQDLGSEVWDYEVPVVSVAATKRSAIEAHRSQLPGGDAEALFPPGIIASLLATERFEDGSGRPDRRLAEMLASLGQ